MMKLQPIQDPIRVTATKSELNYLAKGVKYIEKLQSQTSKLKKLEEYSKIYTKIEFEKDHFNAWNAAITLNGKDKNIIYHFYTNFKTFCQINFPYQLFNICLTRLPSIKLLQTHELFINLLSVYPDINGSFLMSWHDNTKPKNTLFKNQKFITFTCLNTDSLGQCIVDDFFLESQAYCQFRKQVEQQWLRWDERRPIAFWRGASTGSVLTKENWQDNRRVRLCQIAKKYDEEQFIDAKITKLIQIKERGVKKLIRNANLVDSYIPTIEFLKYKYVIDIDGNSNSWPGLFTKLLTGSCVLKVESPYKQWYYNNLTPWVNYVPIKNDMSDLIEKINWCRKNDEKACVIGENGRKLALSMTMETEIPKAYQTIIEALR